MSVNHHRIAKLLEAFFWNSYFNTLPDYTEQLNANRLGDDTVDSIC
jgi:hypothetical protein